VEKIACILLLQKPCASSDIFIQSNQLLRKAVKALTDEPQSYDIQQCSQQLDPTTCSPGLLDCTLSLPAAWAFADCAMQQHRQIRVLPRCHQMFR
jgi:hypothetical protein